MFFLNWNALYIKIMCLTSWREWHMHDHDVVGSKLRFQSMQATGAFVDEMKQFQSSTKWKLKGNDEKLNSY